jgi:putative ribosome biogenesis GTPase RsgA
VMGATGTGKSTFINRLAPEKVEIGHSLTSCGFLPQSHTLPRRCGVNSLSRRHSGDSRLLMLYRWQDCHSRRYSWV